MLIFKIFKIDPFISQSLPHRHFSALNLPNWGGIIPEIVLGKGVCFEMLSAVRFRISGERIFEIAIISDG